MFFHHEQTRFHSSTPRSLTFIAKWFDKFLEHAMLINMHEYFTGRVVFAIHDACNAQYHLDQSNFHFPFQMKNVEDLKILQRCMSPKIKLK